MSRPWMPLYIADYLRDTRRLSLAEHGAYLLLIMEYWTADGLPSDDNQLARIVGVSTAQWKKLKPAIAQFFDDGWRHARIDKEIARSTDISSKRSASAKLKHSKSSASASANAEQMDTHARGLSQPQSQKEDAAEPFEQTNSDRAVANATRPEALIWFEDFWKVFPNREGANPKHPALKAFLRAITDGRELSQARAGEITAAAGRYAAECRSTNPPIIATRSVARALTWLNEKRWQDYPETVPSAHADSNQFHATALSPQLAAWDEYRQRTEGKTYPRDREGGWSFSSEWPPGYVQKAEAA